MTANFLHRHVKAFDRGIHRVGIAASYGLTEKGIEAAWERGLEYVFWNPTARALTRVLTRTSPATRERLMIATGPSFLPWRRSPPGGARAQAPAH